MRQKLHRFLVFLVAFLTHDEPSNAVILLWIVLRLPALQLFEAEETHGTVWAVLRRGVNEASFGQLQKQVNIVTFLHCQLTDNYSLLLPTQNVKCMKQEA